MDIDEKRSGGSIRRGFGTTAIFRRRYFEDFSQYETLDSEGRKVVRFVYTGYWYTQELDQRGRVRHRIAYTLLALLGAAFVILAATRPIVVNVSLIGGLPEVVAVFCFALVLYGVINDCIVPQRRTIGDYKSSSRSIVRGGTLACIASGVACMATLVYAVIYKYGVAQHLLAAAAELIACGLGYLIRRIEENVKYTKDLANPDEDETEEEEEEEYE